jgi:hypothetical protein
MPELLDQDPALQSVHCDANDAPVVIDHEPALQNTH